MSNVIALTKVLIKNNVFGFNGKKKKGKEVSTKGSALAFFLIIAFSITVIGIPMIFALNTILKTYDLSELLISFVIPIGGVTSIVFGVFSIMSVFYFSKDSEQLLPLPIKSSELLISKFLAVIISEYLILLMFIFPIILGIGIGSSASILYYVYSLVICLLMPIIPSVIMSIIIMLVNKVFDFSKRKDLFMYIMTGFILIFSFVYSFGLQYIMEFGASEDSLILLSGNFSSLIKISKWLFPLFNSAVYALINCDKFIGLASFITFIGINIISMIVLYFVGEKLYINGLTKNGGSRSSRKVNVEKVYKRSKGGSFYALLKKEWLVIKRTPVFMLNVVISNLIFPLIFAISFLFSFSSEGVNLSDLGIFIDFSNPGILFISIAIILFLSSLMSSSSSAISRDGSSAVYMKSMPVDLKKQLDVKLCFSLILDIVVIAIVETILMVVFKPPLIYLILINIPLLLVISILNYIGLLLDLLRPKLNWKDENEAVKQNFNLFISMIINIVICAMFVVLGIILLKGNINIYLIFILTSVILLVVYILINMIIKKNVVKLFSRVG